MPHYQPGLIEPKWQSYWNEHKIYRCEDPKESDPKERDSKSGTTSSRKKLYILDMFPYPSGFGLHVGHPEGYTATDIYCRLKRMQGLHVLHPMGWDAFGLPAEQFAIQNQIHPAETTKNNINNFRRQIQSLGLSYDWDREVDTTDPNYVKWTQWIFLQIYDTWYDHDLKKGRRISELPIPEEVQKQGFEAVRIYQDQHRLAYQAEVPVNWCPALGTVLANEEIIDGKSERGNHEVIRLPLRQWLLRITAYADRLLDDLDQLDWTESIKQLQRNWIGKSVGAEIAFPVVQQSGPSGTISVFTTRPDTIFGATYLVLAPEHKLVDEITHKDYRQTVQDYRVQAAKKTDFERTEMNKSKTGTFTGAYALNPFSQQEIPIWIADYVLVQYGTGAIMAVPAHDERDFSFAKQYQLPIVAVVNPPEKWFQQTKSTLENFREAYCEEGVSIQSGNFSGLKTGECKEKIIADLEKRGIGKKKVNFKLRDWLFSRQRYWGEPFPLLHELDNQGNRTGHIRPLSVSDLPLKLPDLADFQPTGTPDGPLSKVTDWVRVSIDGKNYLRETNTMPQWAGSCWYYLRYIDPKNEQEFASKEKLNYWLPVDLYVGGAEHAVLHLLYSRFWHKVLFDLGYVPTPEPFHRLVNQGIILGEMEYTGFQEAELVLSTEEGPLGSESKPKLKPTGKWISANQIDFNGEKATLKQRNDLPIAPISVNSAEVEKIEDCFVLKSNPAIRVDARSYKMSKSRGNVINPDHIITEYGADSLRLYEMFMGPLEAMKPWSMQGVEGVYRFLNRVWRLIVDEGAEVAKLNSFVTMDLPTSETLRILHRTIQKVTEDTENLRFNTAISALMELCNHLTASKTRSYPALRTFLILLSPYAPHLAEELWQVLGENGSITKQTWPVYDPALLVAETLEIPVQINGKLRVKLEVPAGIDEKELESLALADAKVQSYLQGKTIKLIKVVPSRLINIVVV